MNKTGIESIDILIDVVEQIDFRYEKLEDDSLPSTFQKIRIYGFQEKFDCVICDEHKDLDKNILSGLQAILIDALDLEDGEGDLLPLRQTHPESLLNLSRFWNRCKDIVPVGFEGVSSYDWQMDSGEAHFLRRMKI